MGTLTALHVLLAQHLTPPNIIAGIGFLLAAIFKFHQHKVNPC